MQNLDIIEISDEQAYNAKLLASSLSTPQLRKRGMIDMLGILCALNYFHAKRIRFDNKRSVYKIPILFEDFKISDLYYGNYRIDVITLFKEKTIKIPKIHVDMDILPHFYFVVQIGAKIKEAKMIGFIDSTRIQRCSNDSKFYYPTIDMIFGIERFLSLTKKSIPTKTLLGKHIDCMGLFLKFIDNDLSSVYKRQLIQHLMNCDSCRSRFIDTMEFERLAKNIRHYPDLIRKYESKINTQDTDYEYNNPSEYTSFEEGINHANIQNFNNENQDFINIEKPQTNPEDAPKTVQMFDIPNSKETKKTVIDAIFKEMPKFELPSIKAVSNAKTKRAFLISIAIIIIISSFVLISIKSVPEEIEESNNNLANFEELDEDYNSQDSETQHRKYTLNKKTHSIEDFVIKQPISTKPTYSPTITKISFEASESLVKKSNYTRFLQLIGKNVKLNLQNDLLLTNDVPTNKNVKIDIKLNSNGSVTNTKIVSSSHSPAIDSIIKKTIDETLAYMKPPSANVKSKDSIITLIIELN